MLSFLLIWFSTGAVFSHAFSDERICYGGTYILPRSYQPHYFSEVLFFTSSSTGERKVVLNKTQVVDPRYRLTRNSVSVPDVTEKDDGYFSVTFYNSRPINVIRLKVVDCSEKESRNYGDMYTCNIPEDSHVIEFTPINHQDRTTVLWNRTDPQTHRGGRGKVRRNVWEMKKLTQADDGYYNLRRKDNTLLRRWKLTVEEYTEYYDRKASEELFISFSLDPEVCTVTFWPAWDMDPVVLMKSGALTQADYLRSDQQFSGRIRKRKSTVPTLGIEIDYLEERDAGRYEVRDQDGNLGLVVHLTVQKEETPTLQYIIVPATVILGLIFCCCCVRKCCCKKSSSKGDEAVPQSEDEPPVYHHDMTQPARTSFAASPQFLLHTYHPKSPIKSSNTASSSINPPDAQPAGTSHSASPELPPYSYHPINPVHSSEPTSSALNPPVFSPAGIQVTLTGGQGATSSVPFTFDNISSAPEHRFELKGLRFPSAPPLSSDSAFSDVYTSDKLNLGPK